MKLGLIVAKVTSVVVKEIHDVVKRQWDEFGRGMATSLRLETTTSIQRKNKPRAYFFYLGDPIWSNSINQDQNDYLVGNDNQPDGVSYEATG
jgi:hypothetical protein